MCLVLMDSSLLFFVGPAFEGGSPFYRRLAFMLTAASDRIR